MKSKKNYAGSENHFPRYRNTTQKVMVNQQFVCSQQTAAKRSSSVQQATSVSLSQFESCSKAVVCRPAMCAPAKLFKRGGLHLVHRAKLSFIACIGM